jgi:hypothetical protein
MVQAPPRCDHGRTTAVIVSSTPVNRHLNPCSARPAVWAAVILAAAVGAGSGLSIASAQGSHQHVKSKSTKRCDTPHPCMTMTNDSTGVGIQGALAVSISRVRRACTGSRLTAPASRATRATATRCTPRATCSSPARSTRRATARRLYEGAQASGVRAAHEPPDDRRRRRGAVARRRGARCTRGRAGRDRAAPPVQDVYAGRPLAARRRRRAQERRDRTPSPGPRTAPGSARSAGQTKC